MYAKMAELIEMLFGEEGGGWLTWAQETMY